MASENILSGGISLISPSLRSCNLRSLISADGLDSAVSARHFIAGVAIGAAGCPRQLTLCLRGMNGDLHSKYSRALTID